ALAGCELGDVRALLRSRGLEATLLALRAAGVYVSFEEMKGRAPIVREGREIPVRPRDFDNPFLSRAYQAESGGSTGAGSRVPTDLDHLAATAPHLLLGYAAHGVHQAPTVLWRGVLPDGSGIANVLRGARWGNVPRRWFSLVSNRDYRPPLRFRLATRGIVGLGRALGVPLPWPEPVPVERAIVVARYVARTLELEGACLVRAIIGNAVRVCLAAREAGLSLQGATFIGGGEPPTPAKVREIVRSGA